MAPRRTSRRLTTRTSRPIASNGGGRRVSHRGGADMRRVEQAAKDAGWTVERTKAGHLVFRSPDRSAPPIYTASDIGQPRAIRNIESMLRRHGLETQPGRVKKNVGWKEPDELRRAADHFREAARRDGVPSDEERSLHEQAREMESMARWIQRDGQPLTAEEWLGGVQIKDPVDVRYAENELLARERAADEAAPPWRPGFEPKRSSKRRR